MPDYETAILKVGMLESKFGEYLESMSFRRAERIVSSATWVRFGKELLGIEDFSSESAVAKTEGISLDTARLIYKLCREPSDTTLSEFKGRIANLKYAIINDFAESRRSLRKG